MTTLKTYHGIHGGLRTYCFALLLTLCWGASAQTPKPLLDAALGPVLEESRGRELLWVFGHGDTTFYALYGNARRMRKFQLVEMSVDSLQPRATSEFQLPNIDGVEPLIAFPFSTDTASYIIATIGGGPHDEVSILAFVVGEDCALEPEPRVLGKGKAMAMTDDEGFRLILAENRTGVVLLIPDEADETKSEKVQVRILDAGFGVVDSGRVRLPYPAGRTSVRHALADSSGHVHLLVAVADDQPDYRRKFDGASTRYTLVTYDVHSRKVREKFLSLGDKRLYAADLLMNGSGDLQVAGYYTNLLNMNIMGVFSLVVDPRSGQVLDNGLNPFGRDFRLRYRSDVRQRESDKSRFELNRVLPRGPHTTELISEMRYTQTSTVFNPSTGTYHMVEIKNFDDIVVTGIAPDSKLRYNVLIPKNQSSSREEGKYISYVSYFTHGKTYFVFNDNEKNEVGMYKTGQDIRPLTGSGAARPVVATVNQDGQVYSAPLFAKGTGGYILYPTMHHPTPSSMILTLYSGSRIRFARIGL